MDVRGAVCAREQLHQEGRFVGGASRTVEERLFRGGVPQSGRNRVVRGVPADSTKVRVTLAPFDGEGETARRFELLRRPGLEFTERMIVEERFGQRRLHVAGLRLERLLADFGKRALLVDHPAALPAHSIRAGLAGVLRAHPLVQLPGASGVTSFLPRVGEGGQSACRGDSRFRH